MRQQVMSSIRCGTLGVATAFILSTAADLRAGMITNVNWFSGVASVAGTSINPPVALNNDNAVGSSSNTLWVTQKDYVAIGPVDLVFDVIDTGGTTEYLVIEGVQNNTGLDWSGYHLELGFGIGAGFVKSTSGDGLDFDSPDFDSPVDFNPGPGFPTATVTEDDILAGGAVMPDFTFAGYFEFNIDVPDGISEFTLRQSPVPIPEPSAAALCSLGLAGLLRARHRRRLISRC